MCEQGRKGTRRRWFAPRRSNFRHTFEEKEERASYFPIKYKTVRLFFILILHSTSAAAIMFSNVRLLARQQQPSDCQIIQDWVPQLISSFWDNCCDSSDIECDGDDRIINLKFGNKGLTGEIPADLSTLSRLDKLQVSFHFIYLVSYIATLCLALFQIAFP